MVAVVGVTPVGRDVCAAQRVHEGRLAGVELAHHRDQQRAVERLQRARRGRGQPDQRRRRRGQLVRPAEQPGQVAGRRWRPSPARATNRRALSPGASRPRPDASPSPAVPATNARKAASDLRVAAARRRRCPAGPARRRRARSSAPSASVTRASNGGGAPSSLSFSAAASASVHCPRATSASRRARQARGSAGARATVSSAERQRLVAPLAAAAPGGAPARPARPTSVGRAGHPLAQQRLGARRIARAARGLGEQRAGRRCRPAPPASATRMPPARPAAPARARRPPPAGGRRCRARPGRRPCASSRCACASRPPAA